MTLDEAIKHCEEVAENQEQCAEKIDKLDCDSTSMRKCANEHRQLADWLKELKTYKDKERIIYAIPVDDAIRCAMCTNTMANDRGCDGGCVVNEQMYEKVMKVVNKLIVEVNADG